ncbi:MAG: O-antigen ligase family protein [Methylophilus sp.]
MTRIYHNTTITTLHYLVLLTYIGLIAFLPGLHFSNQDIITYHDSQRLIEVLLLILVLFYSIVTRDKNSSNIHTTNSLISSGFFLFFGFTFISIYLAKAPRHALIEASFFTGLYYLALLIANLYLANKETFIRRFIYIIWTGIILYMISFYTGYITATILKAPLQWPKPFTGFTNIRSFNQYQLWLLALTTLPLLNFSLKRNLKFWIYFALTCWWILLFYSASRGVLIAWLAGAILTAGIYQKLAWPLLRIQFINMMTGLIGYYFLFKLVPVLRESTLITSTIIRETTNDRLYLWGNAFSLISQYPYFGVGPMNYPWYNSTLSHPHNSLLQLASEWGLPATIIIVTIVCYCTFCWLKKFSIDSLNKQTNLDKNLAVILFFTITTNAAYSLVDGVIVMPISQVLMFTIVGLMIGYYNQNTPTVNQQDPTNTIKFKRILAFIALITLTYSTWPEIKQALNNHEKRFSMGYTAAGPRIWWEIK